MKKTPSGFTLVEVLVTMTILITVGAISMTGASMIKEKARTVVEVNAARNLITAYLSHAADNGGKVLAGYKIDNSVHNIEGDVLYYPMNARYPWRLAPSVPKIEGVMLFNDNEEALKSPNRDYLVSVHPNLGLNATLVGGHFGTGSPLPPSPRMVDVLGKFYLSAICESNSPEKLLVFSSARSQGGHKGYFEVRPPNLLHRVWSAEKFSDDSSAGKHGFVDFRWGGKCVTAMLAGNIELLDEDQLRDMRRWSVQANRENDPNYLIQPQ